MKYTKHFILDSLFVIMYNIIQYCGFKNKIIYHQCTRGRGKIIQNDLFYLKSWDYEMILKTFIRILSIWNIL